MSEAATKPVPFTVKVKAGPAAAAEPGESEAIVGAELLVLEDELLLEEEAELDDAEELKLPELPGAPPPLPPLHAITGMTSKPTRHARDSPMQANPHSAHVLIG
jgi:hypothetical protein